MYLLAFLIEQIEQTGGFLREEIEASSVVNELYVFPNYSLSHILLLFKLENVLIEIIVQSFVCVVYTELFKTVLPKILKAKDIKYSNRATLQKK